MYTNPANLSKQKSEMLQSYAPKQTQAQKYLQMYANPSNEVSSRLTQQQPKVTTEKTLGVTQEAMKLNPVNNVGTATQPKAQTPASAANTMNTPYAAATYGSRSMSTPLSETTATAPQQSTAPGYVDQYLADAKKAYDDYDAGFKKKYESYGGDYFNLDQSLFANDYDYNDYISGQSVRNNLKNEYDALYRQANTAYDATQGQIMSADEIAQKYIEAAEAQKRSDEQTATMANQLIRKYLPQQLKMQGLGGLGVSQSAYLRSDTDYRNRLADIDTSYNTAVSGANYNRDTTVSELERERNNNFNQWVNAYYGTVANQQSALDSAIATNRSAQRAEQQSFYEQFMQNLEAMQQGSTYIDANGTGLLGQQDLKAQMDSLKRQKDQGKITEDKYNEVMKSLDSSVKYNGYGTTPQLDKLNGVSWYYSKNGRFSDTVDQRYLSKNPKDTSTYDFQAISPAGLREYGMTHFNQGDKQTKRVDEIVNAALNGEIHNGEVVDLNYGNGTNQYVFLDGYFYEVKKKSNNPIKGTNFL